MKRLFLFVLVRISFIVTYDFVCDWSRFLMSYCKEERVLNYSVGSIRGIALQFATFICCFLSFSKVLGPLVQWFQPDSLSVMVNVLQWFMISHSVTFHMLFISN